MQVQIVSPERVLYEGEATQVITRTVDGGEIAFLADHAPFVGALADSHTRIYLVDGSIQDVAVHGGFVEVSSNHVSILSDAAELAQDIDVARAEATKEWAENRLRHEHDAEAESALSRANARLTTVGRL
jgi:F-type H+-transporting ATPase subunit epsilon